MPLKYLSLVFRFTLGVAALGVGACSAIPQPSSPLPMGLAAAAPSGFVAFCQRQPAQCPQAAATAAPGLVKVSLEEDPRRTVQMTPDRWKAVDDLNLALNQRIRYLPNLVQYGTDDYWTPAVEAGDCKDIALAKRQALMAQGWPLEALRLAVVDTRVAGQHAVLLLATSQGDYVLDNRSDFIEPWQSTDYVWEAAQDETGAWRVAGSDAHAMLVAVSAAGRQTPGPSQQTAALERSPIAAQ